MKSVLDFMLHWLGVLDHTRMMEGLCASRVRCGICAYPTTIAETSPRICPKCLGIPQRTRDVLEERIIVQEEALAGDYARFACVLQAADLEPLTRHHTLLVARTACGVSDERWALQRRREAATVERGDGLATILAAEQALSETCAQIAIDDANTLIWDFDHVAGVWSWALPPRLVARRLALAVVCTPGQPQLLGLATPAAVDPRPVMTPLPVAPAGTQARCRSCQTPVVWGETFAGKRCPYDVAAQGAATVSHFATCPNAKSHSKAQPKRWAVAA